MTSAWGQSWGSSWGNSWGTLAGGLAPEINVTGNGVSIVSGDLVPGLSDHTDFGSATQGGATIMRTFTVQNIGDANLTISSVAIPSGYTLVAPAVFPVVVPPLSSTAVQIRLETATAGTRSGNVTIANSDANEASYVFGITGLVSSAPLNLPPTGTITNPVDGQNITGIPYVIVANLNDADGVVVQARLNVNGSFVQTLTSPPWNFLWSPAVGNYDLFVEATDDDAATGNTPTISVMVSPPPPPPPPPPVRPGGGSGRARLRLRPNMRRPLGRIITINGIRYVRKLDDEDV